MRATAGIQTDRIRTAALVAAALLIGSSNALAANDIVCDQAARAMTAKSAPPLTVSNVDHVPPVASLDMIERLDTPAAEDAAYPLLELGPAVESMLNRAFEDAAEPGVDEEAESTSPVAETSRGSELQSELEINPQISRIHDQMFRKDI